MSREGESLRDETSSWRGCKLLSPEFASRKGQGMWASSTLSGIPVQRSSVSLKESSNYRNESVDERSIPCFHLRLLLKYENLGRCGVRPARLWDVLQGGDGFRLIKSENQAFQWGAFPRTFELHLGSPLFLRPTHKTAQMFLHLHTHKHIHACTYTHIHYTQLQLLIINP